MSEISEDAKKEVHRFFAKFDKNGDGTIYKKDLCEALFAFGCDLDDNGLKFVRQHFDIDGDGEIQIEELVDNIDVLIKFSVDGAKLKDAFKKLDLNGDGFISAKEIVKMLTKPGPNAMKEQEAQEMVEQMLDKYDTNRDHRLSYMEFVRMLMGEDDDTLRKPIDNLVYGKPK